MPFAALCNLGCSKNQVDGSQMLEHLHLAGYTLTEDLALADVILVNTCAFIQEAKMEAIEIKMDAQESKMDVKFEAVNSRIDYLFWLQGVIVALILFMLGYMIWDRRTALQPALDKASDANEKSTTLIQTLREYSKKC